MAHSHHDQPPSAAFGAANELGWEQLALPGERDPALGPDPAAPGSRHCVRLMALSAMRAVESRWGAGVEVQGPWAIDPVTAWAELGYGEELASLDGRYTRWLGERKALRSQASALVPDALRALGARGWGGGALCLPGRVWRRDLRDKIHLGEPRQMDVWILRPGWEPGRSDLLGLVELLLGACAPGVGWRAKEARHPYTREGVEVEADWGGRELEALECGLADPDLLARCGLPGWGGLALGMGLDRLCMLAKAMPDIRLLDDPDPKARAQVEDLQPWRAWSRQPGCSRDLSVAVPSEWSAEEVVDVAARALTRPDWLEGVDAVGRWELPELPAQAAAKLGMIPGQANWLLRLRLRDWAGSIPKREADEQARLAWDALHRGASASYRPGV